MSKSTQSKSPRIKNKITKYQNNLQDFLQTNVNNAGKLTTDLNNIVEVTQEHETNRFDTQSIEEVSSLINKNRKTAFQRITECLRDCFFFKKQSSQFSMNVKQQQLIKTIQKLRSEKMKVKPVLPPIKQLNQHGYPIKKTLVLDIDQTLVYSSQNQLDRYDFTFTMPYKKNDIRVYTKNRFGLQSFLFEMSKLYQIIIYTTNIKQYADNVLKNIDKKKRIPHILYKDKCLNLNKIHYLKNLKVLGRDPEKTIFIDHNIASGILQPKNFLQIKPFTGEKHDRQIVKLIPFLRQIANMESIIPINKIYEEFCNRQIRLKFNSIQHTKIQRSDLEGYQEFTQQQKRRYYESVLNSKRKRYSHRKMNSQVESLTKSQEFDNQNKCQINQISQNLARIIAQKQQQEGQTEIENTTNSSKQQGQQMQKSSSKQNNDPRAQKVGKTRTKNGKHNHLSRHKHRMKAQNKQQPLVALKVRDQNLQSAP